MHKLIDLCSNSKQYIDNILKFLESIDDKEYIEKLNNEKKHIDYIDYYHKAVNCKMTVLFIL